MPQKETAVEASEPLWSRCCSCCVGVLLAAIAIGLVGNWGVGLWQAISSRVTRVSIEWCANPQALLTSAYSTWPTYVDGYGRPGVYHAVWVRVTNKRVDYLDIESRDFSLVDDDGSPHRACYRSISGSSLDPDGNPWRHKVANPFPNELYLQRGASAAGNVLFVVGQGVPVSEHSYIRLKASGFLGTVALRNTYSGKKRKYQLWHGHVSE